MWRGERGREGGVLESSHGVGDIGMKHEERQACRQVCASWPVCVSLVSDYELSRGNPPPHSFFLYVVFQGMVELGRTGHTWVCVVCVNVEGVLGEEHECEELDTVCLLLISWARTGCKELLMR